MKANDPRLLVQRHIGIDGHGNPRPNGVFVGFKDDSGKIRTGFSRCNYLMGDKFNMEVGVNCAVAEAILPHTFLKDTPANQDLWDNYVAFIDRANRYFNGTVCKCGFCENHRIKKGESIRAFKKAQKELKQEQAKNVVPESEQSKAAQVNKLETKLVEMIRARAKELGIDVEPVLSVISQLESGKTDLPNVLGIGIADQAGYDFLKKRFPELAKQVRVVAVPLNVADIAN